MNRFADWGGQFSRLSWRQVYEAPWFSASGSQPRADSTKCHAPSTR